MLSPASTTISYHYQEVYKLVLKDLTTGKSPPDSVERISRYAACFVLESDFRMNEEL